VAPVNSTTDTLKNLG